MVSIVGTKLDLLQDGSGHQRGIMRQFVVDYANKIGARSFETSALTGKNVDMVFTETVRSFVKFHPGYKKFAGKPKDKAVDLRQSQSGGGSARGSAGDDGGCACTF